MAAPMAKAQMATVQYSMHTSPRAGSIGPQNSHAPRPNTLQKNQAVIMLGLDSTSPDEDTHATRQINMSDL